MLKPLYLSLAVCAITTPVPPLQAALLDSGWENTGQVLTCPDSPGMDNFPSALAALNGHVLASDVWNDVQDFPDTHRWQSSNSGKSRTDGA